MHLAERFSLPDGYAARPYRGPADHPHMTPILRAYREHLGVPEMPTVEELDVAYAHLEHCDADTDIALVIDAADTVVAYARASYDELSDGTRDCIVFPPTLPGHLAEAMLRSLVAGLEDHMRPWGESVERARYRAYARHPGPGRRADGTAAWLESLGYAVTELGASLVRPHLDDIPDRPLPDGIEVRPVADDELRVIWDAHQEAFRDEWDFVEPTDDQFGEFIQGPWTDPSLWQVAWAGDAVVGQVKSFINRAENEARGYLRGYTEEISTHRDWRNRGIAGALLARSLHVLRDRGMTEAALGADVNNAGGALHLYTSLGFEVQAYEAVYTRPIKD